MATDKKTKSKAETATPKSYYYALGRRKTATATVRLYPENGVSTVNGKPLEEVYPHDYETAALFAPLEAAELDGKKYHITVKVRGGGPKAQIGAIKLGLARAIVEMDATLKTALKQKGLMTRDPRMVERKKPGLRGARRPEQFSKR